VPVEALDDPQPPVAHRTSVTIVGIGVFPDEVVEDDSDRTPRMLLTPTFTAAAADGAFYNLQYLHLDDPARDVDAIRQRLAGFNAPGSVDLHYISIDRANARRGLRPLSIMLAALGLIATGVGAVLSGIALARLRRRDTLEGEVLVELGASPRAVALSSLIAPAVAVAGAAVIAVTAAAVTSPLMPLGPIRSVISRRDLDIDLSVIGLGGLAMIVLAVVIGAVIVWRPTDPTRRRVRRRDSRLIGRVTSVSGSPTFTTGIRMTFGATGQQGTVPMRSVIAGTALSVVTLVVALGFATNVRALTHDPYLFGWNWDAALREGQGFGQLDVEQTASALNADEDIEAWSTAYVGDDLIDGVEVPLLGMSASADVRPSMLSGRFIASSDEIVLGAASAHALHVHLGDTVTIGVGDSTRRLRVVGIAALPSIGGQHVLHPSLGLGAVVTPERIPGVADAPASAAGPGLAFIRLRDATDPVVFQRLVAITKPLGADGDVDVLTSQRPSEIVSASSLGNTPLIVSTTFAAIAALAVSLALVASVRRSSRELALLRTLGYTDGQLARTIAWHAYTIIFSALIAGLPIGIVTSARLWNVYADQLDLISINHTPARLIAILSACSLVVTALATFAPASIARRTSPAKEMRTL
jgi:ABC-type lipoprotein release transport system permease subunit